MTARQLGELLEGDPLTDREIKVLTGAACGETANQTGDRLFLASETIREYRKTAIAKLGAKNIAHAVALALASGVVNPERVVESDECP